jgi:hypothetical protein
MCIACHADDCTTEKLKLNISLKHIKLIAKISLLISNILSSKHCHHHHYQPSYGLHIKRTGHNPLRGPSADWWVLTIANAAGTNGLTCLPKHGGDRDNKLLVTHLLTDQCCLTSTKHCVYDILISLITQIHGQKLQQYITAFMEHYHISK